jgi:hypothetical protein
MYRLYFRDGVNRRIVNFRDVEAANDEEAKAACQPFVDDHHRLELWLGDRLVATLSPQA